MFLFVMMLLSQLWFLFMDNGGGRARSSDGASSRAHFFPGGCGLYLWREGQCERGKDELAIKQGMAFHIAPGFIV